MTSYPQWIEKRLRCALRRATTVDECAVELERLLSAPLAMQEDGSFYEVRHLVGQFKGLRIEIYSREHPPPQFHVSGGGLDATFSLIDGALLTGVVRPAQRRAIEYWYALSRPVLVKTWNETRPSDCPVGPIMD